MWPTKIMVLVAQSTNKTYIRRPLPHSHVLYHLKGFLRGIRPQQRSAGYHLDFYIFRVAY